MNVYAKLQKARVMLAEMELKKSGQNTYAGYDYYELGDFLPPINKLFDELQLFGLVSFSAEIASLTIINTEKPEETIVFTSPMAEANLKGCHPIQNMGAVETYQRRYLYTTALEIVEQDALDKTTGKERQEQGNQGRQNNNRNQQQQRPQGQQQAPNNQPNNNPNQQPQGQQQAPAQSGEQLSNTKMISEAQIKKIAGTKKAKGVTDEVYREYLSVYHVRSTKDLTSQQASKFITFLDNL
jgi:hypothetical protein